MFKILLQAEPEATPTEVMLERIGPAPQQSHHVHLDGEHVEVDLVSPQPGEGWLRIAGRVHPFFVTRRQDVLYVWVDGRTYQFTIVERGPRRATDESATSRRGELTAPMPGTILKVMVAEGDRFKAHQALIVMESMKMEMTISAPHPGRVRRLACEAGQLVDMGTVLATLDDKDEDGDDVA
jgi:propionyl-CoA carboxylase alpha chain